MQWLARLLWLVGMTCSIRVGHADAQFVLTTPPPAPSEAEIARARDSFVSGLADAEAGQWPRAMAAFEDAYRRSGNPAALLNLASALRELGRLADARTCVVELFSRHGPELDVQARARADELYADVTAIIELRGSPHEASVFVDGEPREAGRTRFELEPGLHRLEVRSPGFAPFLWQDSVTAGSTREVTYQAARVALEPPALAEAPARRPSAALIQDAPERPERRMPRWALALLLGAATVAVGAAVALPLVLRDRGLDAPSNVDATYELP